MADMGPKSLPLAGLCLLLTWRVTWAQFYRSRSFFSYHGRSEAPCGPGFDSTPSYSPPYQPPSYPSQQYPSQPYPSGGFLSPYQQAAMMDVDMPYEYMGFGGFGPPQPQWPSSPPQRPQTNYARDYRRMGSQPMSYPPPSSRASRRRVKRQAMFGMMMNCQCDSAADCNMMATMRGRPYNHQCQGRLRLVCCCRGG